MYVYVCAFVLVYSQRKMFDLGTAVGDCSYNKKVGKRFRPKHLHSRQQHIYNANNKREKSKKLLLRKCADKHQY